MSPLFPLFWGGVKQADSGIAHRPQLQRPEQPKKTHRYPERGDIVSRYPHPHKKQHTLGFIPNHVRSFSAKKKPSRFYWALTRALRLRAVSVRRSGHGVAERRETDDAGELPGRLLPVHGNDLPAPLAGKRLKRVATTSSGNPNMESHQMWGACVGNQNAAPPIFQRAPTHFYTNQEPRQSTSFFHPRERLMCVCVCVCACACGCFPFKRYPPKKAFASFLIAGTAID